MFGAVFVIFFFCTKQIVCKKILQFTGNLSLDHKMSGTVYSDGIVQFLSNYMNFWGRDLKKPRDYQWSFPFKSVNGNSLKYNLCVQNAFADTG